MKAPRPRAPRSTEPVLTVIAEDALRRLAIRRSDYEHILRVPTGQHVGRHASESRARDENALVDVMASTEVFTSERLRLLDPAITDQDIFNWTKREKSWQRHGVRLSDASTVWTHLQGYIEIRNAIQHGLGRLTDFQLDGRRRNHTIEHIRSTGCQLDGDRVLLTETDTKTCFITSSSFITWLDAEASKLQV